MVNLPIASINTRHLSYKGYPISIHQLNANVFVYELANEVRIIESSNGSQLLYIDSTGSTLTIGRDSLIYKELLHRVVNAQVLEDGRFEYIATTGF